MWGVGVLDDGFITPILKCVNGYLGDGFDCADNEMIMAVMNVLAESTNIHFLSQLGMST